MLCGIFNIFKGIFFNNETPIDRFPEVSRGLGLVFVFIILHVLDL